MMIATSFYLAFMFGLIEALKPTIRSVNFNSLPQSSNYVGQRSLWCWVVEAATVVPLLFQVTHTIMLSTIFAI